MAPCFEAQPLERHLHAVYTAFKKTHFTYSQFYKAFFTGLSEMSSSFTAPFLDHTTLLLPDYAVTRFWNSRVPISSFTFHHVITVI